MSQHLILLASHRRGRQPPAAPVATQILFATQPVGAASGSALGTQPIVHVIDQYGNLFTGYVGQVTVGIAGRSGAASSFGALTGTATVTCVGGIGTFANLVITTEGVYTLVCTGSGLLSGTSTGAVITPVATQLVITTQPVGGTDGGLLTSMPIVQAQSPHGTLDPTFTGNVTAALGSGSGALSGTKVKAAVGGTATYTDLSFSLQGTNTITFSASGLTSATSNTITTVGIDNLPEPDLTGKHVIFAPNIDAYSVWSDAAADGWTTENPGNAALNDYRNDPVLGANQVISDGPSGHKALRVQYSQDLTTIIGAINSTQTSVVFADAKGFRDPATDTPQAVIDNETVTITALSARSGPATGTIIRGASGSTAASHADGAGVFQRPQETHGVGRSTGGDTLNCTGGHPVYVQYWVRVTTTNGKTLDSTRASRFTVKWLEGFHSVGNGDRWQFSTAGGAPDSRYGMPPHSISPVSVPGLESGTVDEFYGNGTGGIINAAQAAGPWLASYEGTWVRFTVKVMCHSSPGSVVVTNTNGLKYVYPTQLATVGSASSGAQSVTFGPGSSTWVGTINTGDTIQFKGETGSDFNGFNGPLHTINAPVTVSASGNVTVTFNEPLASTIGNNTLVYLSSTYPSMDGYAYAWLDGTLIVALSAAHANRVNPRAINVGAVYAPPKWCMLQDLLTLDVNIPRSSFNWGGPRSTDQSRASLDIALPVCARD